jgi:HPt (histidine-containing phosphotransfer) domain-containing protein
MTSIKNGPIDVVINAEIEEIIPFFFEKRRNNIEALETALAAGDLISISKIGHQIKGSGGSYGFDQISRLGATIEKAANKGDLVTAGIALCDLRDYLDRVVVRYEECPYE